MNERLNWSWNLNYTCPIILCLRISSLSRILMATFSPVSQFRANLTLAKLPSPRVRPSSYLPTRDLLWLLDLEAISVSNSNSFTPLIPFLPMKSPDQDLFFLHGCHTWDFTILIFSLQSANETRTTKPTNKHKKLFLWINLNLRISQ